MLYIDVNKLLTQYAVKKVESNEMLHFRYVLA